jgi:mannose-6-phosphate isomerase-like protein (cupin superfamily)
MNKENIGDKLELITEHWKPVIVGELNDQHVKLAKIRGTFPMHHHEHEDELFLVLEGELTMDYGNRSVEVKAGEFIIVPRGTDHRPIAGKGASILLFEPKSTLNTGNLRNEFTVDSPEKK